MRDHGKTYVRDSKIREIILYIKIIMKELFKSASRIGMLLAIAVTCLWFIFIVLKNSTNESVVIWVITIFTNLITWITTFYYTKKQTDHNVDKV